MKKLLKRKFDNKNMKKLLKDLLVSKSLVEKIVRIYRETGAVESKAETEKRLTGKQHENNTRKVLSTRMKAFLVKEVKARCEYQSTLFEAFGVLVSLPTIYRFCQKQEITFKKITKVCVYVQCFFFCLKTCLLLYHS